MVTKTQRLDQFVIFLDRSEGRDKLSRLVQYFCRFCVGCCALIVQRGFDLDTEGFILDIQLKFRSVQSVLSDARRTNRWLKQIKNLRNMPKMAEDCLKMHPMEWLNFASKACLSVFHTLDHIAWLRKIKLIKGDGKATIRYNLRFLLAANALQAIYQASLYHRLFQAQSTCKDDAAENKQKVATIWRETLRSLMLCIQNLHNSELYETHDWISGLSGVITSAYDALKIWPT